MKAQVLVVALDSPEAALKLVKYARAERPDLHIIARARDRPVVYQLYQAGANDIVRELFDSSLRAGRYVLENVGLSEYEAARAEKTFFDHDRAAVRELAKVWDPNLGSGQNAEYVKLSKKFQRDLETLLADQFLDDGQD